MSKSFRDRVNYFAKNMICAKSKALVNVHNKQKKEAEHGKTFYNKASLPKDVKKALILSDTELPMNYLDRVSPNVRKANSKLKKKISQITRRKNELWVKKVIENEIKEDMREIEELSRMF